jgi:alpha-D-ribose 1-methylphosphonate 5-triphosphate diphosphatase
MLNIINANVVLADEVVEDSCVTIEDGVIMRIDGDTDNNGPVIDAQGAYLMPGMIDVHSDNIEQVIVPRAGSVMDIAFALREQERQLVNNGITTMYHSLSVWKTSGRQKAAREDGFQKKMVREIVNMADSPRLITHMVHIRFDLLNIEAIPVIIEMLNDGYVSLLSFMDHTPGQGQYRDLEKHGAYLKILNPSLSEAEIYERMEMRMRADKVPQEKLIDIARLAKSAGVSIASHDDDSVTKVDFVKNMLNATISEFPVELDVARYARNSGMATLGGAANVMLGKSHSGNLSAVEGVLDGCITMLCSDYYPPSMLPAVFKLHREYGIPLHDCVQLVTLAPAKAAGIDGSVGSVEEGKRADLILVDASGEYPRLMTAITNGEIASTVNYTKKFQLLRSAVLGV